MNDKSKKKILAVDDEESVRKVLHKALDNEFIVIEASDGEDALAKVHKEKPDLILLDLLMPKIDGYTACYEIKHDPELKNIPIIILTALDYALNEKLSRQFGADDYLTKPFGIDELLSKVKEYA